MADASNHSDAAGSVAIRNEAFRNRVTNLSITHKLRHGKSQFDISESG